MAATARRITALLRHAGWAVNAKRVQRIWRREGLKVPHKQPKRGRLWLNDGSCVRLRAERPNHVWSYDFVEDRTHDGRKFRMLCLIDEFTHEALAIRVKRKLNATDVLETLADVMILRGRPAYVRSDNGPEFIALALREWIAAVGAKTAYIEPGSTRPASESTSPRSRRSSSPPPQSTRPDPSGLQPVAASRRSLQACDASLPWLHPSKMVLRPTKGMDHFKGCRPQQNSRAGWAVGFARPVPATRQRAWRLGLKTLLPPKPAAIRELSAR
jgi:transposase InsO family protein